jgi:hypothetical protein
MKQIVSAIGLAVLMLGGLAMAPAAAIEEPSYSVTVQDEDFEVREYAPMIVAEVTVTGAQDEAIGDGFRLLADYIFGNNTSQTEIAMTAPVVQEPASEKIAMTAPVLQTESGGAWQVRFVMPSEYTLDTLPSPNDDRVTLRELPAERVAAHRFSGFRGEEKLARETADLEAWIAAKGYSAIGAPSFAFYDPPWTLWFLRRNEILIPLAE